MIFKIVRVAVISICWCNIQAQLSQILSRFIPQSDYFINDNNENQQTSPNYQQNSFNNLQPQYQSSGDFGSCSNFWSYQNDQYGSYGLVTIPNPNYNKNVLKIILSLAAQLPSQYVGGIDLLKSKEDSANDVANGQPLLYKVRFPLQNPLPQPTAIYQNNRLLCNGPKVSGSYVTTITLDFTFLTGLSGSFRPQPNRIFYPSQVTEATYNPPPVQTQPPVHLTPQTVRWTQPITTRKSTTLQPATQIQSINREYSNSFECGVPDYKSPNAIGLVVNGNVADRGQFPWLAAFFYNGQGDSGFICGGSLISRKLVVTAAHCVHNKGDSLIRSAEDVTFYFGKHNLESLTAEQNYEVSGVTQLIVHSKWVSSSDKFDYDIAVAVLTKTLIFTKFVKPICLWTETSSFEDLVGRMGIVAGWGKTEFNALSTSTPKWAKVPVVDTNTCLRSNPAFIEMTSDQTFCAGNRAEGVGPCSGDSGGGFVVKDGRKWFLRGIISSAIFNEVLSTCDTSNYAVFTDVAKFTDWLQGFIQTYD